MPPDGAVCLAEGAHLDLHILVVEAKVGDDTPSSLAQDSFTVGVVDVDHGPVLLPELGDLVEGSDVPVHGEDAVGDDQYPAVLWIMVLRIVEDALQVFHVVVLVDCFVCPR